MHETWASTKTFYVPTYHLIKVCFLHLMRASGTVSVISWLPCSSISLELIKLPYILMDSTENIRPLSACLERACISRKSSPPPAPSGWQLCPLTRSPSTCHVRVARVLWLPMSLCTVFSFRVSLLFTRAHMHTHTCACTQFCLCIYLILRII